MRLRVTLVKRWKILLIAAALLAVLLFSAQQIARSQDYFLNRDFISFWLAGRLIVTGQDPYQASVWIAGHTAAGAEWLSDPVFLYPLPLAILFAPLGGLILEQAAVVWTVTTIVMLLFAVAILLSGWPRDAARTHWVWVLVGLALFRPTMTTLLHGQLGGLWVLMLAICMWAWQRGRWALGLVALLPLALKPGVGLTLLGLIGLWLIVRRKWTALLAGGLAAGVGLIIGWAYDPQWIDKFSQIGSQKLSATFGFSPTIWGVTGAVCQRDSGCTTAAGAAISLLLLIGWIVLIQKNRLLMARPEMVVACSVPIVLLITPYLWGYDQVLLIIPMVVIVRWLIERHGPYLLSASFFLLMASLSLAMIIPAMIFGFDVWSALLAILCGALLLVSLRSSKSTGTGSQSMELPA